MNDIEIVNGTAADWSSVVDLACEHEKWRVSYNDYDVYKKSFGDGYKFLVAKNKDGQVLGSVTSITFPNDVCYIGIYFVQPKYRNNGIGRQLFDRAMNEAHRDQLNIGLNAKVTMSEKYATAYHLTNYQPFVVDIILVTGLNNIDKFYQNNNTHIEIKTYDDEIENRLLEYDRKITGGWNRDESVRQFMQHPDGLSQVCFKYFSEHKFQIAIDSTTGAVVGYGMIKAASSGEHVLSPLYAENDAIMIMLMQTLTIGAIDQIDQLVHRIPKLKQIKNIADMVIQMRPICENRERLSSSLMSISDGVIIKYLTTIQTQFTDQVPTITLQNHIFSIADRIAYI